MSCYAQPRPTVDFTRDVHAILADRCTVCHNQEKRSSGLSLGTYQDILAGGRTGAAIKPGNSADSLLVKRITGESAPRMPFGGDPLSDREIATIRAWIDEGARSTPTAAPAKARWEPKLALAEPPLPSTVWNDWIEPIDRFTSAYLAKQRVAKPPLVGDAEFARRVYLDIWGLLPDPDQTREFLVDTAPDKRSKLVAALLADPIKYSENWISFWNDLLRNDEGVSYYSETAGRKTITPWLLKALQTNQPYDKMIRQLLNPVDPQDPDGFLTGVNWRGTVSAAQTPAMQASQNAAQIFLGINFKCNSCHDSFINRWKLKDAYALAAYFSSEDKLQLYRCDVAQPGQFANAQFMYPELDRPLPSSSVADRRAGIAAIFADPKNGRVARTLVNRIWEKLMGRGIVENVDDMDGEPWSPELLDWLSHDFVKNGYDITRLIATIASSRTYQLPAVPNTSAAPKEYSFRGPELRRLTAEEFADAVAAVTGDWHVAKPKPPPAPVIPGAPAVVPVSRPLAVFSGSPIDTEANQVINRPAPTVAVVPVGLAASVPVIMSIAAITPRPPAPFGGRGPLPPPPVQGGDYAREWRIAAGSLTRALGRPIRDQIYTTRETTPTTIQALELVNGETLTHWLNRGAQKMLGELPPEPVSLFSRQVTGQAAAAPATTTNSAPTGIAAILPVTPPPPPPAPPVPFDVDVSQTQKLYLVVEDNLSTAPDKAAPVWDAAFIGPNGRVALSELTPEDPQGLRQAGAPSGGGVRVKFPSVVVYDIGGKGFTRFTGLPSLERVEMARGEGVTARFFVFDQKPSMDRLAPPAPPTPLPPGPILKTIPETVDRVYWYLLGRNPSAAEVRIAIAALRDPAHPDRPSASGLADLLWALLMSPEFQLVR